MNFAMMSGWISTRVPVMSFRFASWLSILLFFSLTTRAQRAVPELWGMRVHDEARILSSTTVHNLENQLEQFEDSTTNQIAVLIIPSLEGAVLEQYSLSVVEKWQLGKKGRDNGVLLLIAVNDRKMRIEVGYGLEGALPDITCNQIIRNQIAPAFRHGDFDAGVANGIAAIIDAIGGEYTAGDFMDSSIDDMPWFIGLFVFGILGIFTFLGLSIKGGAGWFLYVFLIPFYAAFPFALYGWETGKLILIAYLLGFPLLKFLFSKMGWSNLESSGGGSGGGWSSGGGGWSSSSGGGFSGGGGSFGGGGSSGSW
ncbi:MAG: TPM domain-containing protein [Cyclobacteriaceae bacterium]|nr:TPM domain-containing protein [Cyclobacteriaceae bacterium]